jgi:phosphatidylglycerol:prolipoprotein diacylglycerol transferase
LLEFTISMDPEMFSLGPVEVTWHGFFSMLAIVVAVALVHREFRRRGMSMARFDALALWTIAGGILGARLFYVFDHLSTFTDDPLEFFAFADGGLAVYGAVVGGFFTVALLCYFYHYPFRTMIDAIAPGLVLAQGIGRLGCAINGDAWGEATDAPFAFVYTNPDAIIPNRLLGVPTHPYPIYDLALNLTIFAVVWRLRSRRLPPGALFALYAVLYAVGRFVISYMREEQVWFWGLQQAQVVAIATFVVALAALLWLIVRRPGQPLQPA